MHHVLEMDREALALHHYRFHLWAYAGLILLAGLGLPLLLWWWRAGRQRSRRWAQNYQAVLAENRLTLTADPDHLHVRTIPLDKITEISIRRSVVAPCAVLTIHLPGTGQQAAHQVDILGLKDPLKAQELILVARDARNRG